MYGYIGLFTEIKLELTTTLGLILLSFGNSYAVQYQSRRYICSGFALSDQVLREQSLGISKRLCLSIQVIVIGLISFSSKFQTAGQVLVLGLWTNPVDLLWETKFGPKIPNDISEIGAASDEMCLFKLVPVMIKLRNRISDFVQRNRVNLEQYETSIGPGHQLGQEPGNQLTTDSIKDFELGFQRFNHLSNLLTRA
ncbi:hypothetical protein BY996DRAFT_6417853 [Phakopsora pachyrhizi]|nr:hypothetical protein BY996DRAFT_6417853 [Phakopsora pachyrhizi]